MILSEYFPELLSLRIALSVYILLSLTIYAVFLQAHYELEFTASQNVYVYVTLQNIITFIDVC